MISGQQIQCFTFSGVARMAELGGRGGVNTKIYYENLFSLSNTCIKEKFVGLNPPTPPRSRYAYVYFIFRRENASKK